MEHPTLRKGDTMTLPIPCPACGTVLQAKVFDLGPLDDKAKERIASIVLDEHKENCRGENDAENRR
jgi:phage terminase large subunit GpA-like protein